jgi:hypothetical protein
MNEYHYDDMLRDEPWIVTRRWHGGGAGDPKPLYNVHHIHPETGHVRRPHENLHQTIPCSNDWEGHGRIIYRCRTCTEDAPDRINGFMAMLRWDR